jgi:hypothetical protein
MIYLLWCAASFSGQWRFTQETGRIAVFTGGARRMGLACEERPGRRMPVLITDSCESRLRTAGERLQADGLAA